MGRRIIVGLDGTDYAANATRIGIRTIQKLGGTLVGVAVVDTPGIEASARGAGVGAYEYAKLVREERLSDAHKKARAFHDVFENECSAAGVQFELAYHDGVPFQALVDEGRFADAIIVGIHTHFHFETQSEPGDTLRKLMATGVCPVVAVPRDADLPQRALVAFDGSIQAARAMRAYANLVGNVSKGQEILLLHVSEGTREDEQVQLIRARQYLAGWGFAVDVINATGKASDAITMSAQEHSPCVVVMGAYGRRGIIKNLFFGSTAAGMIQREEAPLFVYH